MYCSSDESYPDFWETYYDKPWLAVPFGDDTNMKLKALFSVASVPVLVIINRGSKVVTHSGREDIYELGVDALNRWQ